MIKRVVIAECRKYKNYPEAKKYIDFCISRIQKEHTIIIISGGCSGADSLGELYAKENKFPVERYSADWNKYGKKAGPIRNKAMAVAGDYFICFWDGKSKGTKSLIDYATKERKPLKIKIIQNK